MSNYHLLIGIYDHKLGPVCVIPEQGCNWLKKTWKNPSGLIQDGLNTKSDRFIIKKDEFLIQINKFKILDPRLRGGTMRCCLFCILGSDLHLLSHDTFEEIIVGLKEIAQKNDSNLRCKPCHDFIAAWEDKLNQKLQGTIGNGIIEHERRDLITAITGFSQLLLDGALGSINDDQKEYLEYILNYSQDLLKLVKNPKEVQF